MVLSRDHMLRPEIQKGCDCAAGVHLHEGGITLGDVMRASDSRHNHCDCYKHYNSNKSTVSHMQTILL